MVKVAGCDSVQLVSWSNAAFDPSSRDMRMFVMRVKEGSKASNIPLAYVEIGGACLRVNARPPLDGMYPEPKP